MYLSLDAEFKDTEGHKTLCEDFKSLLVKMISDLKEDTKTEEKRKEVSHRPGGEGRPATPEKGKRRSPYDHLKRQDGPGQRKITILSQSNPRQHEGNDPQH